MKILKVYPLADTPSRYNYNVNYGVWDCIDGDKVVLEYFNVNPDNYDVIFLPMYKRWEGHTELLNRLKNSRAKTALFDNDSCYRTFNDGFYSGIDFIFYRDTDTNNETPKTNSEWLAWSINTDLYTPKYGGAGVLFNCSVNSFYPLREEISRAIGHTNYEGELYIKHLQNSAGAIHTDSYIAPIVRAKVLEYSACGTQIISNKTSKMDYFFPDDLITYFYNVANLQSIVSIFQANVEIQKELRYITETKHSDKTRAKWVLDIIENKVINNH